MLIEIPELLSSQALQQCRELLADAPWADGRITAGTQSAQVKNNLQLPEQTQQCQAVRAIIQEALNQNALFLSAALPKRIFPPLFNRYEGEHNTFGNHIDNAIRYCAVTGQRVRTDLSATIFLSDPDSYDGGELIIEDTYGEHSVKLAAGDMVLYPGSSLHRVEPVTRGARVASFFWIESMVRETERRRLLFEMDMSILELRNTQGDSRPAVNLTGCYHNLLRMWAEV
ncbi:MAG: Fe2+-dependent dioxygenase [Methylococcaceae bacterium]|nr:Fe2+-dependent dioxygenase [Methylococcaceae bacterium]MDZ4156468.1 Fe2+-dependent dioxygenase [Methylococcales bacterium]MDP2391684.1 Fe2+-dependent dioxygenase [Methylococcaceae bacterium]MDP3018184.1 Fe2+-dependent dioxygenase [Methylococcaceae bacterium]MDP3389396.1 Fe2+-dependent dioxygenase [Methylococcaceae bacterium]